jgi:uncharacterized protein YidB (DUF937 family)
MNLLDTLGKSLGGGGTPNLLAQLLPLVQQHGGLAGLLKQLEGAGLGDIVTSWLGSGANRPISAAQIAKALGGAGGLLGAVSQQTGLSQDEAASQVAALLPGVVDALTPNGQLPSGDLAGLTRSALASGALGKLSG